MLPDVSVAESAHPVRVVRGPGPWALVALLFAATAFQSLPLTQEGRQCPTAPIQSVLVGLSKPCGCPPVYVRRAPRPGEAGFVQCRCAERQSRSQIGTAP